MKRFIAGLIIVAIIGFFWLYSNGLYVVIVNNKIPSSATAWIDKYNAPSTLEAGGTKMLFGFPKGDSSLHIRCGSSYRIIDIGYFTSGQIVFLKVIVKGCAMRELNVSEFRV